MDPNLKRAINREIRNAAKNVGKSAGRAAGDFGREFGKAAGNMGRDFGREFGRAFNQSRNSPRYNTVRPPIVTPPRRPRVVVPPPVINVNPPVNPVAKPPKQKKPKAGGTAKFWLSGAFMLLAAGILPLDNVIGMAICVGLAILGYKWGERITLSLDARKAKKEAAQLEKEREKLQREAAEEAERERIQRELERRKKSTGNPELDKIIYEGDDYILKLRALNDAIEHKGISDCIDRMEKSSRGIFDYVTGNPSKIPEIKKFMNYYLPTTLKLLESYDKLDRQAVKGENISATMFDIEGMMETIATAFEKQLDTLFSTEAMDIAADIEVFETILTQEGLKDSETPQVK